jgi:hypothetical protein
VSLHAGNAFDVVAERKKTEFRALGGNYYEMEYEITLRNHKSAAITVEVNEPIGGDWEMDAPLDAQVDENGGLRGAV